MWLKMMIGAGLLWGPFATMLVAADFGAPQDEARAMLDKAVAAIKADKASVLAQFNKGKGGFKDRDLYPFCAGPDGMFTAQIAAISVMAVGVTASRV